MCEDFYKTICRICLSTENIQNAVPLFDYSTEDGLSCFGKAVTYFANISFHNSSLPNYMCGKCLFKLKQAIVFKKTCEKSHETLTKLVEDCDGSELTIKEIVTDYVIYKTYFPDKSFEGSSIINNVSRSANHSSVKTLYDIKAEAETVQKQENVKLAIPTSEDETDQSDGEDNEDDFQCEQNVDRKCTENAEEVMDEDVDGLLNDLETAIKMDPKLLMGHLKKYVRPKVVQCKRIQFLQRKKKRKEPQNFVLWKDQRNLKCNVCGKVLANKVTYNNHMQSHTGFRFVCDHCGRGFSYYGLFQRHQAAMHGIGRFTCKECGFKAGRKFEMKEHERIHTGERPFACDKCGKTFRRQFIWKKHLLYHEEKTVQCPHCPRKFYQPGEMRRHCNNVHKRERVYQCSECEATYAAPKTVRQHLVNVHGVPRENQGKITKIRLGKH